MALENLVGTDKYLGALVITNPVSTDDRREGDDHIRGVKNTLRNTFPNVNGIVSATHGSLDKAKQFDAATGGLTLEGTTLIAKRAGATTQAVWIAGDQGQTGGSAANGTHIQSRSDPGTAKLMVIESTTDAAHTPPTGGVVGLTFRVLGQSIARFTSSLQLVFDMPGLANAPAICPAGGANTGLYFPATNEVGLSTVGVARVRVNANTNVCIQAPTAVPTVANMVNGEITFRRESDTSLRIYMRGADGVLRSAALAVA